MRVESSSRATSSSTDAELASEIERKNLWKKVSNLERRAVELLTVGDESSVDEAYKLLAESICLKKQDPFLQFAERYGTAAGLDILAQSPTLSVDINNSGDSNVSNGMTSDTSTISSEASSSSSSSSVSVEECERLLSEMKRVGVPPHLASLATRKSESISNNNMAASNGIVISNEMGSGVMGEIESEDVDPGSTFSDTVTEKVRVKITSFYDVDKSDPSNGKYMFWYKVGIYNEGTEPVQVVARMWEIEKCRGDKEVVRGAGIMSTQPIISPGDVFTYQSVCPLKVFPPRGKRVLGSMSGAYTMCKGNMGQHNFTAKVGKFNLILPEDVAAVVFNPQPQQQPDAGNNNNSENEER